jgi:L-malate glycosyltransferase
MRHPLTNLRWPQNILSIQGDLKHSISNKGRRNILFVHKGDSSYDEMFLKSLLTHFDVVCATFNHKPTMSYWNSKTIVMKNPLSFLYKYPKMRFFIYQLGNESIRNVLSSEGSNLLIGSYSSTYGYMCARALFHPFVLIAYGSDVLLEPRQTLLAKRSKLALEKADLVVVDSDAVERAAIDLGVNPKKLLKFPRFDPASVTQVRGDPDSTFKSKHNLSHEKLVLHTRWFERVYDVPTVIKAFALVNKRVPDSFLILAGDGSLKNEIKKLVNSLGLEDSVGFFGRLTRRELILLNDEAEVYVSASVSDGTSSSLLEAICRNTPVVVSDIQGNRQWVKDGLTGSLFKPRSFEELGKKMIDVLENPEKYREMASQARRELLSKVNWQENEVRFIGRIKELLEEGSSNISESNSVQPSVA